MLVEVLYVDACPHHAPTLAAVRRLVDELGVEAAVRSVRVDDASDAVRRRFLGSPTVRVDGRDIEPGADERTDYVLSCRMYRTAAGYARVPEERWIRAALAR